MIRCVFAPASLAIAILIASATNMKPAANASAHPANRKPNRLVGESSPYLLQHAYNPVNWYAWGDEAFKAARAADKPIFLSIGYSTCYWCHVMERECFEDETIAKLMNNLFVCIKVDREQRPDVDDLYMTGVQLMTGSGGWPMSMFLEPATLKPFYGGTYFPPEDRYGRPGFPAVLRGVADAWKNNRAAVIEQASRIAQAIAAQHAIDVKRVALDQTHVDQAVAGLMSVYDPIDGGFSGVNQRAPKFPQPANLDALIAVAWDQAPVRKAVLHTLDRMAMGGMYDQIGGGFHRYSVDEKWRVPHFEKMLYDNAQLVSTYARMYELTGDAYYAKIVRDTLQYVLREMTSPQGAFYSAQDAEVNALEGGNYVWTKDQIAQAMTEGGEGGLVDFALEVFGVDQGPNFRDPHHPDAGKVNVLFLPKRPEQLAETMRLDAATFEAQLNRVRDVLREKRATRDQPSTDDKILAGWNGLMIAACANGGRVLKRAEIIGAASKAADFVLARMRSDDGGLLRSYRDGKADINAFLEDYAFMIRGLIALHRATIEKRWLDEAIRLTHAADARFKDSTRGSCGWFDTRENQGDLFVRIKSVHDGAVPSGNSVMLLNLFELFEITGERRWFDEAKAALGGLSGAVSQHPAGSVLSMVTLHRLGAIDGNAANCVGDETVVVSIKSVAIDWKSMERFELEVHLDIAPRWHVSAASPGVDWAVPFRIELIDCEGLSATPEYPDGVEFLVEGMPAMRVMSGRVSIPVRIARTADVTGTPRVAVSYQACDDKTCRVPQRITMPLSNQASSDNAAEARR